MLEYFGNGVMYLHVLVMNTVILSASQESYFVASDYPVYVAL